MKHKIISAGHEWQDPESGERTDDYYNVCENCGKVDPPKEEKCTGVPEDK